MDDILIEVPITLLDPTETPEADSNPTDSAGGSTPKTNTNDSADTPSDGENGMGADLVPNTSTSNSRSAE